MKKGYKTPIVLAQVSERMVFTLRFIAKQQKAGHQPSLLFMHQGSVNAAMKRGLIAYNKRKSKNHNKGFNLTEKGAAILRHFG